MPVALPIPQVIPQLYVVLFRGDPPAPEDLRAVVDAWTRDRVEGVLGQVVPRFVEQLVRLEVSPLSLLPVPSIEVLRYMGLGAEEEALFRAATHGVVVQGADLPLPPRAGMWATLCAARAVARHLDGVVLDTGQRRLRALDERDEAPPADGRVAITHHILVPASRNQDGSVWVTTLGLDRFGVPNLEVVGALEHLLTEVTHLVNATAQSLVERLEAHALGQLEGPLLLEELDLGIDAVARSIGEEVEPGDEVAAIGLTLIEDPEREPLIRIHPPGDPEGDVGVWLEQVFDTLFERSSTVVGIESDDEAMELAKEKAISELPEVRRRWGKGLEMGDSVYVKAGFPTPEDGLYEFMWVAVEQWADGRIVGRLANDPEHAPDLKAGQAVTVEEVDVCDWIWARADGTREGGYTVDVLLARQQD